MSMKHETQRFCSVSLPFGIHETLCAATIPDPVHPFSELSRHPKDCTGEIYPFSWVAAQETSSLQAVSVAKALRNLSVSQPPQSLFPNQPGRRCRHPVDRT